MDATRSPKIAIVWRGEAQDRGRARLEDSRFAAIARALSAAGFAPEACLYAEAAEAAVKAQLLGVAAALVFVNPLQDGRRRQGLDALLREVATAGVWVSAHPDVIDKLGVKAVLWTTRSLGWGSDVVFHTDPAEFAQTFPARLARGPRVLKPNRGNGGRGVWKVEGAGPGQVRVELAEADSNPQILSLPELFAARAADFVEAGGLVDQAWQPRVGEGMVRCYMSGDRIAGFGAQRVRALAPATAGPFGPRLYSGAGDPRFQGLRVLMEAEWIPALCRLLAIDPDELPLIWDADFLPGEGDRHVLCEINASSVFPIPDEAAGILAETLAIRLGQNHAATGGARSR